MLFFAATLCTILSLVCVASPQELLFAGSIGGIATTVRLSRPLPNFHWLLIGCISPFASFFGPYALLLSVAFLLLYLPRNQVAHVTSCLRPLSFLLFTWFIAECCFSADWALYLELLIEDPRSLIEWWRVTPPIFIQTAWSSYRFFLFFFLLRSLVTDPQARSAVFHGVLIGTLPAFLISLSQHFLSDSGVFVQHNEFWALVGRFSGSFQDPNSFGISAALLIVLAIVSRENLPRAVVLLFCFGWFALALFSGSRTFFVYLTFFAFLLSYYHNRKLTLRCIALGAMTFTLLLGLHFFVPGFSKTLPVGIERLVKSFDPVHLWALLGSRVIFSQIAFALWKDVPLFGIGPNHFKQLAIPYGEQVGFPLGTWTDNPNNFYLDLLVQFGLVGIFTVFYLFRSFSWNHSSNDKVAQSGFWAFLVALLLGPHLNFTEVVVLASLLGSLALVREDRLLGGSMRLRYVVSLFFMPLFLFGIFFQVFYSDRGYYQWEQAEGYFYRWTKNQGAAVRPCELGQVQLLYYSAAPHPLELNILTHRGERRMKRLSAGESAHITLSCDPVAPKRLFFTFEISPHWIPKAHGIGEDPRVLGVQERVISPARILP